MRRLLFATAYVALCAGIALAQGAVPNGADDPLEGSGSAPAGRGVFTPFPGTAPTPDAPPAGPEASAGPAASGGAIEPASAPPAAAESDTRNAPIDKRIFGVLPNYRTANANTPFTPLTVKQKFYIGYKDSIDYPVFPLAGAFAGLAQLSDQHPVFGQGMKGYAHRFGTALLDQDIGNFMTESIMPTLFHQDPRYFRRGYGSFMSRLGYAATRIFVAPTDGGHQTFNFSEVVGNAASAGIANAYYPGERRLGDNIQRFYTQLATDSFSQVLKEFWPDVKRKFLHKKQN